MSEVNHRGNGKKYQGERGKRTKFVVLKLDCRYTGWFCEVGGKHKKFFYRQAHKGNRAFNKIQIRKETCDGS